MILDTSVLVSLLRTEPDSVGLSLIIAGTPLLRFSAANYVELSAVIDGERDPVLSGAVDTLIQRSRIEIAPFTAEQARIARDAYRRFGRGSGHPARLNMGDCFAYACARDLGEPLLFKGHDFALTDIEIVTEPVKSRRLSEVVAAYSAPPGS